MKTLVESLFDNNLAQKDLLEDPEFKEWINNPETLWYIEAYWTDEIEDPLEDFMPDQWAKYKPQVVWILDQINKKQGKMWSIYRISYDAVDYFDEIKDAFGGDDEYYDAFDAATYEIKHMATEEKGGISKTWFKGSMPKNSSVTSFVSQLPDEGKLSAKPGALAGGIFLATDDVIVIWGFPRGLDKDILKLFDIK